MSEQIDIDWSRAELDVECSDFRSCPGCAYLMSQPSPEHCWYCSVHRCAATTKAGTRCKNVIAGENPAYCTAHACVADWTEASGRKIARCASQGTMHDIPDGRRVRICTQHHQKMWAGQPGRLTQ